MFAQVIGVMVLEKGSQSGPTAEVVAPERLTLLTHDIRAALSDVVGGLSLIDASEITPELRSQFEQVRGSADLLSRLLEDALSAWLGQSIEPHQVLPTVHLQRLVRALHVRCELFSRYTGTAHRINVSIADTLPKRVRIDGLSLERILTNVLANALRHVPDGKIDFFAYLDDNGALVFEIQDNGPGLPEAELHAQVDQKEFEPFTRGMPGSGYGLRIARDLAHRLGGKLDLVNRTDQSGTCVMLRIPAEAWTKAERDHTQARLPDLGGKTVLLADDSDAHRMLLAQYLAQMGAQCVTTSDAAQASAKLREHDIDIAVLDIDLPMQSGLTVMQDYRQSFGAGLGAQTVFIAVTAFSLPGMTASLESAGFDGVITKPIGGASTFGRKLAEILGLPLSRPANAELDEKARPDHLTENLERLMLTVGPAQSKELLRRLQNDLSEAAKLLRKGVAENNAQLLRRWAHVAGAVAGSVGANDPQLLAVRMTSALDRGGPQSAARLARTLIASIDELIEEIAVFHHYYGDVT